MTAHSYPSALQQGLDPSRSRRLFKGLQHDVFSDLGLAAPNPAGVLFAATAAACLALGIWFFGYHVGLPRGYWFAKEGPFEDVTFVLELLAAAFCFIAARRWPIKSLPSMRLVPLLYASLGLVLLFVGMEEINWGQTLFKFATPEHWTRINYQHETSLHNLLDKSELTHLWRIVSVAFGAGTVGLTLIGRRLPGTIIGAIAPHPSLMPLALLASYAGARVHPEAIELLLSVFFAFYSYRIWVAARSRRGRAHVREA